MSIYRIALGVLFTALTACKQPNMSRIELRSFMLNKVNGVIKDTTFDNGLKLEASLLRPELLNKEIVENHSLRFLMLSFSLNGREALIQFASSDNYARLVQNLSYNAANYCRLIVNGKDTAEIVNYAFSNYYGTSPANNLLMVIKPPLANATYELQVDDFGFQVPDVKFVFSQQDIDKYYKIKIKR